MENHPLRSGTTYGFMYAACFLIVLVFAALLLQIGSSIRMVSILMLAFLVCSYLFAGFTGRTMSLDAFQFADRQPGVATVGQAIASGAIASGIFVILAGIFYQTGISALAYFWGWLLGLALMTILFAADISRSGKATLPAALAREQDHPLVRVALLLVIMVCCILLLFVQLEFIGRLGGQLLGMSHTNSIFVAAVAISFCVLLSGMQGVTLIRAISYPVILIAFLAPLVWISANVTGLPIPQLAFGSGALQPVAEIDQELVEVGLASSESVFDLARDGSESLIFSFVPTVLCIAFATAASPHLLSHFTTVAIGREARHSGLLAFGLVFLFLSAVPAVAAFVRFEIYTTLLGVRLGDLATDANWAFSLSGAGSLPLITICGALIDNVEAALSACSASTDYFLTVPDIGLNPDLLVVGNGLLNELPQLLTVLISTGAILALYTTCDGLFLTMGLAISNDGYQYVVRPKSPKTVRLFMTRFFLVVVILITCWLTSILRPDPMVMFEFSLAITAASLFPVLVSRMWGRRSNGYLVLAASIIGLLFTLFLLTLINFGADFTSGSGDELVMHFPITNEPFSNFAAGLLGTILSTTILLSRRFLEMIKQWKFKNNATDVPA